MGTIGRPEGFFCGGGYLDRFSCFPMDHSLLLLLAAAISPAMAVVLFIYWRDKHEKEPVLLLLISFLLGVLSIVPALFLSAWMARLGLNLQSSSLLFAAVSWILGVGLTEEFSKFFLVRLFLYPRRAFNEPFDGIIYCAMCGMGFATVENVMYVLEGGYPVALGRAFFSIPGHASWSVLVGYFLGRQKFEARWGLAGVGLLLAACLHGLFNFFLSQPEGLTGSFVFFLITFFLGLRYALRAIRLHRTDSPFRLGGGPRNAPPL
jgi:RsiW-degrading membrane proteinase PrsW (M82 family)